MNKKKKMDEKFKKWVMGFVILLAFITAFSFMWDIAKDDFNKETLTEEFKPQANIINETIDQNGTKIFTILTEDNKTVNVNEKMFLKEENGRRYGIYYNDYPLPNGDRMQDLSDVQINVKEDGGLKRIENARSLKNTEWEIKTLNADPEFDYEVIDYNTSSLEIKPILKTEENLNKDIPLKINNEIIGSFNYKTLDDRSSYIFKGEVINKVFSIGFNTTNITVSSTTNVNLKLEIGAGDWEGARNALSAAAATTDGFWEWEDASGKLFRTLDLFNLSGLPVNSDALNVTLEITSTSVPSVTIYMTIRNGTDGTCTVSTLSCASKFDGHTTDTTPYLGTNLSFSSNDARDLSAEAAGNKNFTFNSDGVQLIEDQNEGQDKVLLMYMDHIQVSQPVDHNPGVTRMQGLVNARTLHIQYQPGNEAPTFDLNILNSTNTNQLNFTNADLSNVWKGTDTDAGNTLTTNKTWYTNNLTNFTILNEDYTSGTLTVDILNNGNLTEGQTWHKQTCINDETVLVCSNSSELLIRSSELTFDTFSINSTFGKNLTNDDIWADFSITSLLDNGATVNITFKNNNVTNYTLVQFLGNGVNSILKFTNPNFSKDDAVHYELIANDSSGTFRQNSSTILIRNTPIQGVPTLIGPASGFFTVNYTIWLNASISGVSDNDTLDQINVEFEAERETTPPTITIFNNTNLTSDVAFNYTLGSDGTYYWRVRANDNSSVTAYTSINNFLVERRMLLLNQTHFLTPVQEGSNQFFQFNISFNPNIVASTDVVLTYNNTIHTLSRENITTNFTKYQTNLNLPLISNSRLDKLLSFNVTINLINGTTIFNNSFTGAQTLIRSFISDCNSSNSTTTIALNFSLRHEENDTFLVGKAASNFLTYTNDININRSYTFGTKENITSFQFCITPIDAVLNLDGQIQYEASNNVTGIFGSYDPRDYYFRNFLIDNLSDEIGLYSLDSAKADGITFIVTDPDDIEIENAIIDVKRYNVGNNTVRTIAMGKTNFAGKDLIFLRKNDVFYTIIINQLDGIVTTFANQKIISDEVNIKIVSTSFAETSRTFRSTIKDITLTGKTYKAYYNDSSGKIKEGCFRIQRINLRDSGYVSEECIEASSGSFIYTIDNSTSVFIATLTTDINPSKLLFTRTDDFTINELSEQFGIQTSVFIVVMLLIVFISSGLWTPVAAVWMAMVGMLISFGLGILPLTYASMVSLIISLILLMRKLKN